MTQTADYNANAACLATSPSLSSPNNNAELLTSFLQFATAVPTHPHATVLFRVDSNFSALTTPELTILTADVSTTSKANSLTDSVHAALQETLQLWWLPLAMP